jgi:hypothetical protein
MQTKENEGVKEIDQFENKIADTQGNKNPQPLVNLPTLSTMSTNTGLLLKQDEAKVWCKCINI